MGKGSWARAVCHTCQKEWEGTHAMMVGKKHAQDHGHQVHWTQEHTGMWDYTDE